VRKAKQERDAVEIKLRKLKEMEKKNEQERSEKQVKQAEVASRIQSWIEEYDASVKQKRRLQQKRMKAEQELENEKKSEMLNKAKVKFQVCRFTISVLFVQYSELSFLV